MKSPPMRPPISMTTMRPSFVILYSEWLAPEVSPSASNALRVISKIRSCIADGRLDG